MKLQYINHAEAIIQPFFDGGDSDYPSNKISQLCHYSVTRSGPEATVYQDWCGLQVNLARSTQDSWIVLERDCDLDVSAFDRFLVFAALSSQAIQTVELRLDGDWVTVCREARGSGSTEELSYPFEGRHLTGLRLRIQNASDADCACAYTWLGLADSQKAAQLPVSHFPADWPDMMLQEGDFSPRIGIWFDDQGLEELRRRVKTPLLAPLFDRLCAQAEEYLNDEPEKRIAEYVPNPDRRWVRARDRERGRLTVSMETLAFVGILRRDARMLRMAVRMALSAVHCDKWTESFMGALPGCAWHHRSFTEEIYCKSCALVLDWAGGFLTDYGRMAILDAIIMKGLPRIESDFRRQEYIRSMNQGIVFSSGRLYALLACRHYFPRYERDLQAAEQDLLEMIGNYILPDGGTQEGCGYWNYTFSSSLPLVLLLARSRNLSLSEYAPACLHKTAAFGLFMLSVSGDGTRTIPVNDGHTSRFSPVLLSCLYTLTGNEAFRDLLALGLENRNTEPTPELFLLTPDLPQTPTAPVHSGLMCYPELGQARIIRETASGRISFSFYTGPARVGHFHMDKGSFVLEDETCPLLIDRGVLNYSHPDSVLVHLPAYHNLLMPELPPPTPQQPQRPGGARLLCASFENDVFEAAGDQTDAWDDERILKQTRSIRSESPLCYEITDHLALDCASPAAFFLQTRGEIRSIPGGAQICFDHCILTVEALDWDCEVSFRAFSVDENDRSVNRLCLRSAAAREHTLRTRITVTYKQA